MDTDLNSSFPTQHEHHHTFSTVPIWNRAFIFERRRSAAGREFDRNLWSYPGNLLSGSDESFSDSVSLRFDPDDLCFGAGLLRLSLVGTANIELGCITYLQQIQSNTNIVDF